MGTVITLAVENIDIDWSKNTLGNDYGELFQKKDLCRQPSDQIDYDYYAQHPEEDISPADEMSFARTLASTLPRLNLLGHTLQAAQAEYDRLVREAQELDALSPEETPPRTYLTFAEFCDFVSRYPLASLDETPSYGAYKASQSRFMAEHALIQRIPLHDSGELYWSEKSHFGALTCCLSSYSMLQVYGCCPANAEAKVVWQYGPLVHAGWVNPEAFYPEARRHQTILIATEGTSDIHILKKALSHLQPEVLDFFRFIDISERHPFPGTGSLLKFAEGLVSIDLHNQVIFLLDNDAEGVETFRKMEKMAMPANMKAMVLPDHASFATFPTRGPEGSAVSNINGRAAAIECYLDLDLPGHAPAHVVWSNYKKETGQWQGALNNKELYTKHFLNPNADMRTYNLSKLEVITQALMAKAVELAGTAPAQR